jgi:Predicted membrane protein
MGHTNTKRMVQGAMIAGLFGVLSLLNTYTGSLFDILICYVMVVPLVWYGYTYSLKENAIVCIASMIVIIITGLPFFVISSLASCCSGMFIGECLKRKAKKETILFGTLVISFINNFMIYEVFSELLGVDLVGEIKEIYLMIETMLPSLTQSLSVEFFLSLIPIVLFILSALEMYVIVMICQLLLSRLNIEFPGSFHIAFMHIGQKTGFLLLGIILMSYFLSFLHIHHIYLTYMYMISFMSLALQGLSLLSWILIVKRKVVWMIVVFVGILIPYIQFVYVVLGLIDIFSDFREKIMYNKV